MGVSLRRFALVAFLAVSPSLTQALQYSNVAVVASFPGGGGDFQDGSGGDNLVAALNQASTWCGSSSSGNRCLVKLLPGTYDLGARSISLPIHVDLEGSGQKVTTITGATSSTLGMVIVSTGDREVRNLTIESTNGAVALLLSRSSSRIVDVTVRSSGSAFTNTAILAQSCLDARLERVFASATGASQEAIAVRAAGPNELVIARSVLSASGAAEVYGIYNAGGSNVRLLHSEVEVFGASLNALGVYQYVAGSVTVLASRVTAKGNRSWAVYNTSVYNGTGGTVVAESSTLTATWTAGHHGWGTTLIASSRLAGGAPSRSGGGTLKCVHTHNDAFDPVSASCTW